MKSVGTKAPRTYRIDDIESTLQFLTTVVLELRSDTKALRKVQASARGTQKTIFDLRARVATLTAERKLLRKVESTLSGLMVERTSHEHKEMIKKKFRFERNQ